MRLLALDHAPKHGYDTLQKLLAFLGLDGIHPLSRDQRIEASRTLERRAMSRKRQRSARERFPFPSAMLFVMDPLASSRCLAALVRLFFSDPSSRSPTQLLNRTARRYTSSFS